MPVDLNRSCSDVIPFCLHLYSTVTAVVVFPRNQATLGARNACLWAIRAIKLSPLRILMTSAARPFAVGRLLDNGLVSNCLLPWSLWDHVLWVNPLLKEAGCHDRHR